MCFPRQWQGNVCVRQSLNRLLAPVIAMRRCQPGTQWFLQPCPRVFGAEQFIHTGPWNHDIVSSAMS